MKYYYFGEFGFLNFSIIGAVEEALRRNPDRRFEIATFPDYYSLLSRLFPGSFTQFAASTVACMELIEKRDRSRRAASIAKRRGAHKGHSPLDAAMEVFGHKNLWDGLTAILPDMLVDKHAHIRPSTPITHTCPWLPEDNPIVSICCRHRTASPWRDLTRSTWAKIIATVRKEYPGALLVFHGLPHETHPFDGDRTYQCQTIWESVHYLNRSMALITSITGFAEFAANCGCSTLQIGKPKFFRQYTPFGTTSVRADKRDFTAIETFLKEFSF